MKYHMHFYLLIFYYNVSIELGQSKNVPISVKLKSGKKYVAQNVDFHVESSRTEVQSRRYRNCWTNESRRTSERYKSRNLDPAVFVFRAKTRAFRARVRAQLTAGSLNFHKIALERGNLDGTGDRYSGDRRCDWRTGPKNGR